MCWTLDPQLDATAKAAFNSYMGLTHAYISSFATYNHTTNDSKAIFNVEFVVKGTDTIIKDKARQYMRIVSLVLFVYVV